jgi:hypothetical protein
MWRGHYCPRIVWGRQRGKSKIKINRKIKINTNRNGKIRINRKINTNNNGRGQECPRHTI